MKSFDFNNVKLTDGILKAKQDETLDFYLQIPNDNILKYMRESAGKSAPGIYYTGWYPSSRGIALIGQWLSAYSRMYAITENDAFREKAIYLSDEFWNCCRESAQSDPFFTDQSHYDIEKLMRAQCDLFLYCNDAAAREHAAFLVNFAEKNLSVDNVFGNNATEWYTLPESCLDVWEIFHIEKAKELAARFEYREFWDLFYQDKDPFSRRPEGGFYSEYCHAYSHVNSFNSCARIYGVSRDPYYLKALRSFYSFMNREEIMCTGGYGPNFEHLMPKYRIIDALRTGHDSFETQCDTYAAFRLVKYLTEFSGEANYGNWVESLMYNAALATIPMTEDGKVIYYSDYNMYGARKINRQDGWTCCTGTRPLLMSELQRLIYFEDQDGLYISQFMPSSLEWNYKGTNITIKQETDFPVKDSTKLIISLDKSCQFDIHFRMPEWLAGKMTVSLNEKPLRATVSQTGWLTVSSVWNDCDVLSVSLPQKVWMHSFDPVKKGPNAFLHGPVVLAADYSGQQTPNDRMDVRSLVEKMRPVPDRPLHYTVDGIDTIAFRPYYEFAENERYFLYHDTTAHALSYRDRNNVKLAN